MSNNAIIKNQSNKTINTHQLH